MKVLGTFEIIQSIVFILQEHVNLDYNLKKYPVAFKLNRLYYLDLNTVRNDIEHYELCMSIIHFSYGQYSHIYVGYFLCFIV